MTQLSDEQNITLAANRRRYGILGRMLFTCVPYQAWEHIAYIISQPRFS
jgi:hypothetical protein